MAECSCMGFSHQVIPNSFGFRLQCPAFITAMTGSHYGPTSVTCQCVLIEDVRRTLEEFGRVGRTAPEPPRNSNLIPTGGLKPKEKGAKGIWKHQDGCRSPEHAAHTRQGRDYLSEVDGFVFGNAVGVFAGKHPAVAAVHLLWDLLE